MENSNKPLVSICSITYNHAPYIRQCLDGMLMQQTDFTFEIIINDDCSTDGTTEIIREYAERYPEIVKPVFHEENQYQKGVRGMFAKFVFPKAKGKYIALCEGDDYWTDPLKLQKQVDFLEANENVMMVYTGFQTVNMKGENVCFDNFEYYQRKSKTGDVFRLLLQSNFIMTLTTCYRRECLIDNPILDNCPKSLDYALFLTAAAMGDVVYLPESTACYRRLPTGMIATKGAFVNKVAEEIYFYFANLFLDGNVKSFTEAERNKIKTEIVYHYMNLFLKGQDKGRLSYFLRKRKLLLHAIPAFGICVSRVNLLSRKKSMYR